MRSEPEKMTALVGGRLIDGNGGAPIEIAAIIIQGALIKVVGRQEEVPIPPESQVYNISGKTVMPGMIDCHCHISVSDPSPDRFKNSYETVSTFKTAKNIEQTLRAGFTTIRDAGGLDIGFRQAIRMGLIEGPRLIISNSMDLVGWPAKNCAPAWAQLLDKVDEGFEDYEVQVRKQARRIFHEGYDFVTICSNGKKPSHANLQAVVDEANFYNKAVMAEVEEAGGIKDSIRAGVWSIEQASQLDDEAIDLLLETGVYVIPTLFVAADMLERGAEKGLSPDVMSRIEELYEKRCENFARAAAAGVRIATGSDAFAGSMHGRNARELTLMVENGLTPSQAIVAATKTAAEVCRVADRVGTLESGKLADLLVVDGNPLQDISVLQDRERLLWIMREGVRY